MYLDTMEKLLNYLTYFLKALICFMAACLIIPILLISFTVVHYSNQLVYYVLSIKYPNLTISKSKKIRTLIDTPRNAGIFHFLIQVRGECDFAKIKQHYEQYLIGARDKIGLLKFPKLRQRLITCWGHYAWMKDNSAFDLNNHILLNTDVYRGRSVNDGNIQNFISDLARKYIPSDLPQWQIIVIPTTTVAKSIESNNRYKHYYILVKIHHLIIAEEDDLHISEMLMLEEGRTKPTLEMDDINTLASRKRSLACFVRCPEHIENLLRHIGQFIVNRWNMFIYTFESLEMPDGCNHIRVNNVTQLVSILFIIIVNAIINWWKSKQAINKWRQRYPKYVKNLYKANAFQQFLIQESEHYNLTWQVIKTSLLNSFHPIHMSINWCKIIWYICLNGIILMPYNVYCEFIAMGELIFKGQTSLHNSYCAHLSLYLPLIVYAFVELLKICWEIFIAPVNIYEEVFQCTSQEANILHMKSYSGRKIVSFSKSIDANNLRKRIQFNDDIRESDFTLACMAGALYDYFNTYADSTPVPQMLNTTCRTILKGYFTERCGDKSDNIGGVIFLQLPLRIPNRQHVRQIYSIVEQIRYKQFMIYLASIGQTKHDMVTALLPRVLTKICINYFSHNFPVTITKIYGDDSEFRTLWGELVSDVLLFRPPQSKTCLSLNIHRFGNKYRLAIMADTELGPDHSQISRSFEKYMENAIL